MLKEKWVVNKIIKCIDGSKREEQSVWGLYEGKIGSKGWMVNLEKGKMKNCINSFREMVKVARHMLLEGVTKGIRMEEDLSSISVEMGMGMINVYKTSKVKGKEKKLRLLARVDEETNICFMEGYYMPEILDRVFEGLKVIDYRGVKDYEDPIEWAENWGKYLYISAIERQVDIPFIDIDIKITDSKNGENSEMGEEEENEEEEFDGSLDYQREEKAKELLNKIGEELIKMGERIENKEHIEYIRVTSSVKGGGGKKESNYWKLTYPKGYVNNKGEWELRSLRETHQKMPQEIFREMCMIVYYFKNKGELVLNEGEVRWTNFMTAIHPKRVERIVEIKVLSNNDKNGKNGGKDKVLKFKEEIEEGFEEMMYVSQRKAYMKSLVSLTIMEEGCDKFICREDKYNIGAEEWSKPTNEEKIEVIEPI